MVRDMANIAIAIKYDVMYLPLNDTIEDVVRHYLDVCFQGHYISGNIFNVQYLKNLRSGNKYSSFKFIHVDICDWCHCKCRAS